MTQKDYIATAEIFASHMVDPDHCEACDAKYTTLGLLAVDIAAMFQADNPRFKPDRFFDACGFNQGVADSPKH